MALINKANNFSIPPLPTLSTVRIPKSLFKIKDKRVGYEPIFHRFIALNSEAFNFLGIKADIVTINYDVELELTSSAFVGVVPIRSAESGIYSGVLSVTGRYGEQPQELMELLIETITPEYNTKWVIDNNIPINPPIFMECYAYLDAYLDAEHSHWRKFSSKIRSENAPKGETLWSEYALRSSKNPLDKTVFKNKNNILTNDHSHYRMLNYVCKLALDIISQSNIPVSTRALYDQKCARIKRLLNTRNIEKTDKIPINASDPKIIKSLKISAEPILKNKSNSNYAWRMDYSDFFEKFVQYVFKEASKTVGAWVECNSKFRISSGHKPAWGLAYLEPDVIVRSEKTNIIIDAKYKSHLYNYNDQTDELKNSFRHDLHQVLAYTSLISNSSTKNAILAYPSSRYKCEKLNISGITHSNVHLLGIPIDRSQLNDTIQKIRRLIQSCIIRSE